MARFLKFFLLLPLLVGFKTDYTLALIIKKLEMLESSDGRNLSGDNGKAVGILHIHPIMVEEVNRISGSKFTLEDRKNPRKSRIMAKIFLGHQFMRYRRDLGCSPSESRLASAWNSGSIWKIPGKYKTKYEKLK